MLQCHDLTVRCPGQSPAGIPERFSSLLRRQRMVPCHRRFLRQTNKQRRFRIELCHGLFAVHQLFCMETTPLRMPRRLPDAPNTSRGSGFSPPSFCTNSRSSPHPADAPAPRRIIASGFNASISSAVSSSFRITFNLRIDRPDQLI